MTQDDSAAPLLPYEAELASGAPRAKEAVKGLISWSTLPLGSLIRVATREPAIALTFDDGPDRQETPRVLDVLERHGARGTFFQVGKSVERYPEIVARAAAAGHALANHSWDHPSFRQIRGSYRRGPIRSWRPDPRVRRGPRPPRRHPALPAAVRRAEPRLAARRPALRPPGGLLGRCGRGLARRSGRGAGAEGDAAAAAGEHRALPRHALCRRCRALPRPRPHA